MVVGQIMRTMYKSAKLTQAEVAKRIGVVNQSAIARAFTFSGQNKVNTLIKFAHVCGYRVWIVPTEVFVEEGILLQADEKEEQ